MKKTYIAPQSANESMYTEMMLASSITAIGGNSEIEIGTGDIPEEADVKDDSFFGGNIFE